MKKLTLHISCFIIICNSIISCSPDNKNKPGSINTTPSYIIVKEKSISGKFDSMVWNIRLFPGSDSIYFDSVYIENPGFSLAAVLSFNYSRFAGDNFLYINQIINVFGGDTTSSSLFFDDNKRITSFIGDYVINLKQTSPTSVGSDFSYDANNRMNSFIIGSEYDFSVCHIKTTGSSGMFYTNATGVDSLLIATSEASCNTCWYCSDSIEVTFLSKANNTNELYLSYPAIPSLTGYPSYNNLFFLEYIPFPKMKGKLIDKVSYFIHDGTKYSYTNTYTYDADGRVKTAKFYYFDKGREELFEFNY